MIPFLAPPASVERERSYHWVDKARDLDMTEVERLTFRVEGDGKTVRERVLVRTELDGAKVPASKGAQPEILKLGEVSKDPLTARIDRIASQTAPGGKGDWQATFAEAPPLQSGGVGFHPLLTGPKKTIASLVYQEPGGFDLRGRATFGEKGILVFFSVKGLGIRMPGSDGTADLTVTEGPVGKVAPWNPGE